MDFLQEVAAVPNEAGLVFEVVWNFLTGFQTIFSYPSAQGVVAVRPRFFRAVFFEDFRFNQLVVQVVEIVLHFAVGQFAVDQVAGAVVAVAAFDRGLAIARRYFGFAFTAFRQIIEGGDLFFQTT